MTSSDSPFALDAARRAAASEPVAPRAPAQVASYAIAAESPFALGRFAAGPGAAYAPAVTSFEQLAPGSRLAAAVGAGQPNQPADVRLVQARLRELGMTWVPDTGAIGTSPEDPTGRSIRLFLAMLDGKSLWAKDSKDTPAATAYQHPLRNPATIVPGSRDEIWLWASNAPRWLASAPAVRDGWAPASDRLDEPAMSSWFAEYLDLIGRAFRDKLAILRPVLGALKAQGPAALDRMKQVPGPPVGPPDPRDRMVQTAWMAARVADDVVGLAAETRWNPVDIAGAMLKAIEDDKVVPTLVAFAKPPGGLTPVHIGHQQGLEGDFRLFAHDGASPGLVWGDPNTGVHDARTSLLLIGLLVDCMTEQPLTRKILYNDPSIRKRVALVSRAGGHDNHVHVYAKGAEARTPVTAPAGAGGPPNWAPRPVPPAMELGSPYEHAEAAVPAPCPTCGRGWQGEAAPALEIDPEVEPEVEAPRYAGAGAEPEATWRDDETPAAPRSYTTAEYIALVQKVERAYPKWTPDEVLAALRRIAGCDAVLFRVLFATQEGSAIYAGDGGLTCGDLCDLAAMSAHRGTGGVVYDAWHGEVAIGHVLCGITAGLHRNVNVGLVGSPLIVTGVQLLAGLTLDNLYATTIAGDLGQSAVLVHLGQQPSLLGPQSEATDAELIGDIDGFVLGTSGALAGRRISDILTAYYSAAPPSGNAVHFSHRFRLFAPTLSSPALDDQTRRFARAYMAIQAPTQVAASIGEIATVLGLFRSWYARQLSAEIAHH